MLSRNPAKHPRCKQCRARFVPDRPTQEVHVECIQAYSVRVLQKKRLAQVRAAKRRAEKLERANDKVRAEKLKSTAKWEDECRKIVQEIARIRDRHDGCISCHMGPDYRGDWHGSHFRSHGAASAVQLNLWNIHKSCAQCNLFKSGNRENYEPRLIEKIGQAKVDWLNAQNQIVRHDEDYYRRFKAVMGKRRNRLKRSAMNEQQETT